MKDQSLRKLQQEMDSLTFRNQQLAKRVELLQDELALSEARGKKNKVCAKGREEKTFLITYLLLFCQSLTLISGSSCFVPRAELFLSELVLLTVMLVKITLRASIDTCNIW